MELLARTAPQAQAPTLAREVVDVPSLGAAVIVQELSLAARLALHAFKKEARTAVDGESEDVANARVGAAGLPYLLANAVVLEDGAPLWSASQWDTFASRNLTDALALFKVAQRLAGLGDAGTGAAEKN